MTPLRQGVASSSRRPIRSPNSCLPTPSATGRIVSRYSSISRRRDSACANGAPPAIPIGPPGCRRSRSISSACHRAARRSRFYVTTGRAAENTIFSTRFMIAARSRAPTASSQPSLRRARDPISTRPEPRQHLVSGSLELIVRPVEQPVDAALPGGYEPVDRHVHPEHDLAHRDPPSIGVFARHDRDENLIADRGSRRTLHDSFGRSERTLQCCSRDGRRGTPVAVRRPRLPGRRAQAHTTAARRQWRRLTARREASATVIGRWRWRRHAGARSCLRRLGARVRWSLWTATDHAAPAGRTIGTSPIWRSGCQGVGVDGHCLVGVRDRCGCGLRGGPGVRGFATFGHAHIRGLV